jgi:hypothetical protein
MEKTPLQQMFDCFRRVSLRLSADVYLVSGGLYDPLADDVMDRIAEVEKRKKNALLVLTTFGGNADVAYRIARSFQRTYNGGEFAIMIYDLCKSAGTLLAVGASKLIMADSAQLGPLDVQLGKPDSIGEKMSGLTPCQSLAFLQEHAFKLFEYCFLQLLQRSDRQITFRTATQIAAELTTGLFDPVYAHLDPMRLGEYHRDMMVAAEYGKRLNRGNLLSPAALTRLTHGYPSHGFIIDREEARELFKYVEEPTGDEIEMLGYLDEQIQKDFWHQDADKDYVGVVRFIDVDIDLTPKDTSKKEVSIHEEEPKNKPECVPTEQEGTQPRGIEVTATDVGHTKEDATDTGGTASNRPPGEVVEHIEKEEEI